jgi:hypothetical protein
VLTEDDVVEVVCSYLESLGYEIKRRSATTAATLNQSRLSGRRLAGIALPDTSLHRKFVARVRHALDTPGISVLWIAADHTVTVTGRWRVQESVI